MIRSILLVLFSLLELTTFAQTSQSIFEWKTSSDFSVKEVFRPLIRDSYTVSLNDPKYKVYTLHTYTVKNSQGDTYTNYDGFSIEHKGKSILSYYTGDPLYNCGNITLYKDKSRFLQIPLDDKSFALCFGGWFYYDQDEAPELVIVVVSEGKAKVVFDNYAFAYKYTPAPNFSIEFVNDWSGIDEDSEIYKKPSFLRSRTKHKIWREGNVLKYKSWK